VSISLSIYVNAQECDNLKSTTGTYSENDDLVASVQSEFGSGYTVADWTDLEAISDMNAWIACMNLVDDQSFNLLRNGVQVYSGDRQYLMRYCSDGDPGGSFLIHDQIGSYIFLGSWTGSRNVLAIGGASSINEKSNINLLIYPNPATNNLTIELNSEIQQISIELYDITGKMVYMKSYKSNSANLNVFDFETGTYILKVKNIEGQIIKTEKIVKK